MGPVTAQFFVSRNVSSSRSRAPHGRAVARLAMTSLINCASCARRDRNRPSGRRSGIVAKAPKFQGDEPAASKLTKSKIIRAASPIVCRFGLKVFCGSKVPSRVPGLKKKIFVNLPALVVPGFVDVCAVDRPGFADLNTRTVCICKQHLGVDL
jgi:hypothetical protein